LPFPRVDFADATRRVGRCDASSSPLSRVDKTLSTV